MKIKSGITVDEYIQRLRDLDKREAELIEREGMVKVVYKGGDRWMMLENAGEYYSSEDDIAQELIEAQQKARDCAASWEGKYYTVRNLLTNRQLKKLKKVSA